MSAKKNIVLGGFILIGLTVLTALTLTLSGGFRWGYADRTVYFGRDSTVKEGYEVFTSGKKVGIVTGVELVSDPAQMKEGRYVKATMSLKGDLTLWEGAEVLIVARGLLGGVGIELYRGDPTGAELGAAQPLNGRVAPGFFDDISGVVRDNRDNIARTTEQLALIIERISRGEGSVGKFIVEEDFYKTMTSIANRVDRLLSDVQAPESSLGRLLRDKELYDELYATMRSTREVADGLRNGKGTLGRLLTDDQFAKQLEQAMTYLRDVAQKVERGEGTLGKLISDDQIHRDLVAGVAALRRFTERIEKGQGTFTRLLDDDSIYENLRILSENLKVLSEDVRSGKGTLGLLLKDESVYKEMQRLLESFRESGEIARENAPLGSLTSFTSLFFNVLN